MGISFEFFTIFSTNQNHYHAACLHRLAWWTGIRELWQLRPARIIGSPGGTAVAATRPAVLTVPPPRSFRSHTRPGPAFPGRSPHAPNQSFTFGPSHAPVRGSPARGRRHWRALPGRCGLFRYKHLHKPAGSHTVWVDTNLRFAFMSVMNLIQSQQRGLIWQNGTQ